MRLSSNMNKILLLVVAASAFLWTTGCKSAEDTNNPPLITAIRILMGGAELVELTRDTTVTLRVDYTDEDYSSSGSGDLRFEPDITWSARFDGTSVYFNNNFVDPSINSAIFTIPDQPGLLRIEVSLTDRYNETTFGYKLIEIKENQPPMLRDFTVDGNPIGGLIAQVQDDERVEIGVEYIDDDYDPDDPDPDPMFKPSFLWSAAWHDTGALLNDSFFDRTTNPCLFDTPVDYGFIDVSVLVTDRDGEASQESFIIEISENEPPVITSIDIGSVVFHVSTEKTFKVTANDPDDPTGTLTYEWWAGGGSFNTLKTLPEVKWQANAVGQYELYVTVTDEDGGWDREDFTLQANNKPPEITGYDIDNKNPEPGTLVLITLAVTDPDAEDANTDLVYDWSADGGGFSSEIVTDTGAEAEWLAPQTEGPYVISVTVYDPWGGEDSINIPPITVEKQPEQ